MSTVFWVNSVTACSRSSHVSSNAAVILCSSEGVQPAAARSLGWVGQSYCWAPSDQGNTITQIRHPAWLRQVRWLQARAARHTMAHGVRRRSTSVTFRASASPSQAIICTIISLGGIQFAFCQLTPDQDQVSHKPMQGNLCNVPITAVACRSCHRTCGSAAIMSGCNSIMQQRKVKA